MPDAVDRDALAFAWVRATHLASPETVADELLAASAAPALRLNGVTALGARLRAAEILRKAGYRDSARNVLLESAGTSNRRSGGRRQRGQLPRVRARALRACHGI